MAEVVSFVDPAAALQKYLNVIDTNLTNVLTDPGDAGTVSVTNSGTLVLTTGGSGETRDLPDPTFVGQKIDVCLDVHGGGDVAINFDSDITDNGDNVLTFTAAGQAARLIGVQSGGSLAWRVLRGDNAAPTIS